MPKKDNVKSTIALAITLVLFFISVSSYILYEVIRDKTAKENFSKAHTTFELDKDLCIQQSRITIGSYTAEEIYTSQEYKKKIKEHQIKLNEVFIKYKKAIDKYESITGRYVNE